MTRILAILAVFIFLGAHLCEELAGQDKYGRDDFASEVVYHVIQRSFYDSDGDGHGDLAGLTSKLDYLQDLGVTTVLMLPIYPSIFYHNYFPTSFEGVDEEFGTLDDYRLLLEALHERGMKLIMDVEIHYVTDAHLWWDSYENPESEYSDYIIYNGPGNTEPESMIFGLTEMTSYTGEKQRTATANLMNENVKTYHTELFEYWIDPNGDGDFSDGVDGFRIDHMMDDLDKKGVIPNMFEDFWHPLLAGLHALNPDLIVIAEQADWTRFGETYFEEAGVDAAFAFQISWAIAENDKARIEEAVLQTMEHTPEGHHQIVFLNNHDTDRFASVVEGDPARLRSGAVLATLLYGVPSIYYGEEIGMRGMRKQYGAHDGNDIPVREAMEWYADAEGEGMAYWYRESGPWWDDSLIEPNDGISVEEQRGVESSLWSHYQSLLALRASKTALQTGKPRFVASDHDEVLAFVRESEESCVLVAVSLAANGATATLEDRELSEACRLDRMQPLSEWSSDGKPGDRITLAPGQVLVWESTAD